MSKLIKMALMMAAQMRLAQGVSRVSGAAKWAVLALICGIGELVALVVALWVFLIPRIGPEAAALSMAGLLAVMAIVFALVARATLHPHRTHHVEHDDASFAELKDMFVKHKGTAILSAIIAGMAMANGKK
jgi:hypothetical protein